MELERREASENPGRNGFTLLEIMVALAILSVLFTLIYGVFNATVRVAEEMEREANLDRLVRLTLYRLTNDLSMVYGRGAAPSPPGEEKEKWIFKGENRSRAAEGKEFPNDAIRFTAVSHGRVLRDAPESDRAVVSYLLEEENLIYEARLSNDRVVRGEVGEGLEGMNFRYWDGAAKAWVDQWDAEERNGPVRLPQAVEIELFFKNSRGEGRSFKTWVEIPMGGNP